MGEGEGSVPIKVENIQEKKSDNETLRLVKSFSTWLLPLSQLSSRRYLSLSLLYFNFTLLSPPRRPPPLESRSVRTPDYRELNGITRENETKEAYYERELFFNFQLRLFFFAYWSSYRQKREREKKDYWRRAESEEGLNNYNLTLEVCVPARYFRVVWLQILSW